MTSKTTVIKKSGIFLRPTPPTHPLGIRLYRPDPPNLPERIVQPRRLPVQQPSEKQ
jgi:hypothetical protein